MYSGRLIFSQVMDFMPMHQFRRCVDRYKGNYHVKGFTCLDQFLCMAFAQLSYRESLRDIESCLRAMQNKLYHIGIRSRISKSTLAYANENRDWRIYADFAQYLISIARELYANDDFGIELNETVYALDASTIDLCLSLFPWARFRKSKGHLSRGVHFSSELSAERRNKTPYIIRSTWQYSIFHFYNRWKSA